MPAGTPLVNQHHEAEPYPSDDAELRAGVEPLAHLLDERAHLVAKVAPLYALYGPGGLAEHTLSAERARVSGLLRAMAASTEQKITEAALEMGSRAHPDYLALMAKMTAERAEYFRLNAHLDGIEFRINRGQSLLRFASAEARLG